MKKLISLFKGKISYWLRGISFFYFNPNDKLEVTSSIYKEIFTLKEFIDLKLDFEYSQEIISNRFIQGSIFCFLEADNSIVSYGWINSSKSHYVGELDFTLQVKNNYEILFDFYTFPKNRNKGYYRSLLNHICVRNNTVKVIYALKDNLNSINGIKNAGFKFLYNVYGINKNRYINLPKIKNGKNNI